MIAPILITKKLPNVTRQYPSAVKAFLVTVFFFLSHIHAVI